MRQKNCRQSHGNLLIPESRGDVFKRIRFRLPIHLLVGRGRLQWSQMLDVRTDFQIVEVSLYNATWQTESAAIPSNLKLRMFLMDILRQQIDAFRIVVATHEGDAGNVAAILLYKGIDGFRIQRKPDVLPEIVTMTSRTVTRAITDVDCQCHFVRNFLKNNPCIYVL